MELNRLKTFIGLNQHQTKQLNLNQNQTKTLNGLTSCLLKHLISMGGLTVLAYFYMLIYLKMLTALKPLLGTEAEI